MVTSASPPDTIRIRPLAETATTFAFDDDHETCVVAPDFRCPSENRTDTDNWCSAPSAGKKEQGPTATLAFLASLAF
jgi:hypothetical protein